MRRQKKKMPMVSWNPMTGCTKCSSGCKNCYAEALARKLNSLGVSKYSKGFEVTLHPELLNWPFKWKNPRHIFVNSMSDVFHKDVPLIFIKQVFETMKSAYWHEFQVLTKRSERLKELAGELPWPDNLMMGVTVESQKYVYRVEHLLATPAKIKYICAQPLVGPLNVNLEGIDWVITGGESGPYSRQFDINWVRSLRDQCTAKKVRFLYSQYGACGNKMSGSSLDGVVWNESPLCPRDTQLILPI